MIHIQQDRFHLHSSSIHRSLLRVIHIQQQRSHLHQYIPFQFVFIHIIILIHIHICLCSHYKNSKTHKNRFSLFSGCSLGFTIQSIRGLTPPVPTTSVYRFSYHRLHPLLSSPCLSSLLDVSGSDEIFFAGFN